VYLRLVQKAQIYFLVGVQLITNLSGLSPIRLATGKSLLVFSTSSIGEKINKKNIGLPKNSFPLLLEERLGEEVKNKACYLLAMVFFNYNLNLSGLSPIRLATGKSLLVISTSSIGEKINNENFG